MALRAPAPPKAFGISMSSLSLILLVFQNSSLILVMHHSRVMPPVDGRRYLASTAVFLSEAIKLVISVTLGLYEESKLFDSVANLPAVFRSFATHTCTADSWKMSVPAILYTLQNNLQYVAVSDLDPATYQVTYQLKILSVAIFSVILLRRQLNTTQWMSLFLLMIGIAIVQIPTGYEIAPSLKSHKEDGPSLDMPNDSHSNALRGLIAAILSCLTSGLAGVYFEKVLKDSTRPVSLKSRNVQISSYSLSSALFVILQDRQNVFRFGFCSGYNWITWVVILLQAIGGLLVSAVVNYSNNIAKGFATSISIVLSFLISVAFLDAGIKLNFVIGASIVILATCIYNRPQRSARPTLRPLKVEDLPHEKQHLYQKHNVSYSGNLESAREPVSAVILRSPFTPDEF